MSAALELDTWSGDQHDTSLFALWKNTKTKLDQLASGSETCGGARALHDLVDFQDFSNLNIPPPEIQAEPMQLQQPAPLTLLDPSIEESVPQTAVLSVIPPSVVPISTVRNEEEMSDGVPGSAVNVVGGPSHGIPSPFKRHFYYPASATQKNKTKKLFKERMPTIVSGKQCQEYFIKK